MIKQNINVKIITFVIYLFTGFDNIYCTSTYNEDYIRLLSDKVNRLELENKRMYFSVEELKNKNMAILGTIDSLEDKIEKNSNAFTQTVNQLGIQIKETGDKNEGEINKVEKSLSKNSLYGIIGVLSAILLSGLLYWLLSKRRKTDKTDFDEQLKNKTTELKKDVYSQIENTKSDLITESAKLDFQLLGLIEKQLKVADRLNVTEPKIDHTFHKNSANELQRIANYANSLDPKAQEAIALHGSLGRLRNYFNSSDYEITDFTGEDYDERIPMKIKDTFFEETLAKGSEVIARTLKPQIKYKGEVIQEAEVSTKYNN